MTAPKKIEEGLRQAISSWETLAPTKSFGGLTLDQFKTQTAPSFAARDTKKHDKNRRTAKSIATLITCVLIFCTVGQAFGRGSNSPSSPFALKNSLVTAKSTWLQDAAADSFSQEVRKLEHARALGMNRGLSKSSDMPLTELINFVVKDLDDYWRKTFTEAGWVYKPPSKVDVSAEVVDTPCGKSEPGNAFYCPKDHNIYADYNLLAKYYKDIGDFTVLLILAHEWGHLIQAQLGISKGNNLSISVELQADCFAGAYSKNAADRGIVEEDDPDEGIDGLFHLKDPKGVPWLDSNAHGKGYQRIDFFMTGFKGNPYRCGFIGSLLGVWETDVNDAGLPQKITMQFNADGNHFVWTSSAFGTTGPSVFRWRYDNENLYLYNTLGALDGIGAVKWVDADHLDVTVVQNASGNSNKGRVRNLSRRR